MTRTSRATSEPSIPSVTSRLLSCTSSRVVDRRAGQLGVERGQRRLAGRVDQHARRPRRGRRSPSSRRCPALGQVLARLQDLLHHGPPAAGGLGQAVEVALRVGQPVGVVDAQAVDGAVADQPQDELVGRVEDLRVLDPQPGEGVDREEPAVVQVAVGPPPVDQLVVLAGVHLLRRPPAPSRARAGSGCRSSGARRPPPPASRRRRRSRGRGCGPCRHRTPSRCRTPRRARSAARAAARPTTTAPPTGRRRPCGWARGRARDRGRAGAAPRRSGRSPPGRRAPRRSARGRRCRSRGCCPRPSAAAGRSRRA